MTAESLYIHVLCNSLLQQNTGKLLSIEFSVCIFRNSKFSQFDKHILRNKSSSFGVLNLFSGSVEIDE